jgi:hypothetical protein
MKTAFDSFKEMTLQDWQSMSILNAQPASPEETYPQELYNFTLIYIGKMAGFEGALEPKMVFIVAVMYGFAAGYEKARREIIQNDLDN